MRFLGAFGVVILLIIAFPHFRFFVKRLICKRKIKKLCQKKGYRLHALHLFWFFKNRNSPRCDFYIETPNEVFAVKMFGITKRRCELVFTENGKYFIRSFMAFISYGSGIRYSFDSKAKPLPDYNFRYNYKEEWEIKTPRRILLVNPVPMEFRRQPQHGSEVIVGAGEIVNGMEIDSLPRLLEDLEDAL